MAAGGSRGGGEGGRSCATARWEVREVARGLGRRQGGGRWPGRPRRGRRWSGRSRRLAEALSRDRGRSPTGRGWRGCGERAGRLGRSCLVSCFGLVVGFVRAGPAAFAGGIERSGGLPPAPGGGGGGGGPGGGGGGPGGASGGGWGSRKQPGGGCSA